MSVFQDYLELTKPRLTLLVLATAFLGFYMASPRPFETTLVLHAIVGSALIGAGINTLNQYLEHFIDAKMRRTESRPIPSGRVRPDSALIFGSLLAVAGDTYLFFFTNRLTGFLGVLIIVSYLFFYTPLKQKTAFNTLVGAIPGALPCVMGWAAAQNALPKQAWPLFLILFFWQLPHFFAIAWVYREDYANSGFKMLTLSDADGRDTGKKIILGSLLLFPMTLLPVWAGLVGNVYLGTAILSGIFFILMSMRMYKQQLAGAKKFVSLSIYYLLILIIAMVADKI